MSDCKCEVVKQYEPGVWQCMICRKQFVPLELVNRMDPKSEGFEPEWNLLFSAQEAILEHMVLLRDKYDKPESEAAAP